MHTAPIGMTIADYCTAMQRNEIIVNARYQRSDKVWPPAAQSYLIETILLGYPVPNFFLLQVTDVKSKKTYKEIVDGQQRSVAIRDFFQDKLRLSRAIETEDLGSKTYSGLSAEYREQFLNYQLSISLLLATTPEDVREVFRRINSYTIPLNPEERRHASFQGQFKWFIQRLAKRYAETFVAIGLFGDKQLVRLADTKLLAEVCHALLYGIETTNKRKLWELYKKKDGTFPEGSDCARRLSQALDQLREWTAIHQSLLMKPHITYALMLAVIHMRKRVRKFERYYESPNVHYFDETTAIPNLLLLADALGRREAPRKLGSFVAASSERTNVRGQRTRRFKWFCRALSGKPL